MNDITAPAPPINDRVAAAQRSIDDYVTKNVGSLTCFSGLSWTRCLNPIEDIADPALDAIVNSITTDECAKTLIDIVKDRRQRLPLSSSTGAQITGLCGQLLAFGAAGLALAIGFVDKIEKLAPALKQILFILGIFYTELVLLSLVIIAMYLLQATFRYPYLYFVRIGNAWPSFYYASISSGVSRNPLQWPPAKLRAAGLYANDLLVFADKCVTETVKQRLRNEVQQYFLLVAYSAYSHQFSLRLGNTFLYGLFGAFVSSLVIAGVAALHPR